MIVSEHAAQARAQKMAEALACGIDDALISRLVERFYETIRQDAMLGPIFAQKIADWPHHLGTHEGFLGVNHARIRALQRQPNAETYRDWWARC